MRICLLGLQDEAAFEPQGLPKVRLRSGTISSPSENVYKVYSHSWLQDSLLIFSIPPGSCNLPTLFILVQLLDIWLGMTSSAPQISGGLTSPQRRSS